MTQKTNIPHSKKISAQILTYHTQTRLKRRSLPGKSGHFATRAKHQQALLTLSP